MSGIGQRSLHQLPSQISSQHWNSDQDVLAAFSSASMLWIGRAHWSFGSGTALTAAWQD